MIRICVPATSANIGPGFDALGIALSMWNRFDFEESDRFEISGCDPAYAGPDNLFAVAFTRAAEELGRPVRGLRLGIDADIPLARGLGSSAAMIVGGAAAACLVAGRSTAGATPGGGLDDGDLRFVIDFSARMEGHPDNAVPAVLGGFCAALMGAGGPSFSPPVASCDDKAGHVAGEPWASGLSPDGSPGGPDAIAPRAGGEFSARAAAGGDARDAGERREGVLVSRTAIGRGLMFHALVPPFELSTKAARAALPAAVSHRDAVFNAGRAALVACAFSTGDYSLLGRACDDRLHQPWRAPLIPGYAEVVRACRDAGALAVWLSGAGPTVMAVTDAGRRESFGAAVDVVLSARPEGAWRRLDLEPDNRGLVVDRP